VLDLVCYRKLGHNETDEPAFTQPVEYRKIAAKPRVATIYSDRLVSRGDINESTAEAIAKQFETELESAIAEFQKKLTSALNEVKNSAPRKKGMKGYAGTWSGLSKEYIHAPATTAISEEMAFRIADQLVNFPTDFKPHPKLGDRVPDGKGGFRYPSGDTPFKRRDDIKQGKPLDWGTGEALAYGSLLLEGHPVRLSGQDSRRGTFSHRHAVLYDHQTGAAFCPLSGLSSDPENFSVFDSHLSEAAVLGFEYGYSLDAPNSLVIWEAQFGDFVNGAQVIIDQFLSSAETKWNRSSGLVLLLPHGYEGAGPEHSSARPERFLQLCAEDNIQVCNFTTPAQIFHALRRQLKRPFRKPLIVMTPKSLLRHPQAVSPLSEFTQGRFHEVLDDSTADPAKVRRVVLCWGKVYYDLLAARTEGKVMVDQKTLFAEVLNAESVALVRVEQLYPWPGDQLRAVLNRYPKAELVWAQEEPKNMGGWFFVAPWLRQMGYEVEPVCRTSRASPAVGSKKVHDWEQAELVDAALSKPAPYEVE
jgi:2-oxoglutarate dehydrogenase E1 component